MITGTSTADGIKTAAAHGRRAGAVYLSLGIPAWNEEKTVGPALESLFRQSLFSKLNQRAGCCEIVFLANGCTDRTSAIAENIFTEQAARHPHRAAFFCRSLELQERGKIPAWNSFVHQLSEPEARYLFLMDADILIEGPETLWNMITTLEMNPDAAIATDRPKKSISGKLKKSWSERLSLGAAQVTQAGEAQLCGQLYCIRSEIARRIYLPKDLSACEDGFIKAVVCTDFLTRELNRARILAAPGAAHTFAAYTSISRILKNQKRQMIGQAMVHILVDDYLRTLAVAARKNLAVTLAEKDRADPFWLKRLIKDHVQRTKYFWRLIPGLAAFRFKGLAKIKGGRKVIYFPAAVAGFIVSMISCFSAYRFLKRGYVRYWPHGKSADSE